MKSQIEAKTEIQELVERLIEDGNPVIVEGKKDKRALRYFGLRNIVVLDRPLYAVVEKVSKTADACAILTDLDQEGKFLFGKLNHQLQKQGVRIDNKLRNFLFRHTQLRQIEGLDRYLERIG